MNRKRVVLLLAFCLAVPCLVYAQGSPAEKKQPSAQMYEDVEVMRRILNRSLHLPRHATHTVWVPANGLNTNQPFTTGLGAIGNPALGALGNPGGSALGNPYGGLGALGNTWTHPVQVSSVEYPGAEGVYLKGHGVVFNLILPPQKHLKPETASPAPKTLSEWERVRKEIRGEKPNADSTEKKPKEPTVVETLLKVLADNGKHFSQLAPDETVTIVVTFRTAEGGQSSPPTVLDLGIPTDQCGPNLLTTYQLSNPPPKDPDSTQEPKLNGPTLPAAGEVATKGLSGKAKDNLLLADLNYKQNKYAEAVQAYTAALKELSDNKKTEEYAQVCQKLAQALLAEGKVDEAKKYLDLVIEQKKIAPPAALPKDPAPTPLPSKLILSAPKKLLDQIGSGKMSFEEFKKDATAEYFPAAPPETHAGDKGDK